MSEPDLAKEPSVTMTRKDKRDLMLVAATVVVAVVVVGALLAIQPEEKPPILRASLQPSAISIAAGRTVLIVPTIDVVGHLPIGPRWSIEWHVNPYWLGSIDQEHFPHTFEEKPGLNDIAVNFTAGEYVGSGNITYVVTYGELATVAVANITVGPPVLEGAVISPSDTQVLQNKTATFKVVVHDSLGHSISDFDASWSYGSPGVEVEFVLLEGKSIGLTLNQTGNYTLTVSVSRGNESLISNTSIEVIGVPQRTVDFRWYDMFNVPFDRRWAMGLTRHDLLLYDQWQTDTYPYLLEHARGGGVFDTYAGMRLNITARNVTSVSMNERPVFIPYLGEERGGSAEIDWYMQYLTSEELRERYSPFAWADDGWIIVLNGTVALDKQAAKAVINLTDDGFDKFDDWWSNNSVVVEERYMSWLVSPDIVNIDFMEVNGWPLQLFTLGLNASKVGDRIILNYDIVTWGMEVLMMGWLRETVIPTEWWFEDMDFHASIGPYASSFDIDAAVPQALKASNSTQNGTPCWIWQGMLQEPVPYDSMGWPMSSYNSHYYKINQRYMDMGSWVLPWDPMPGGLPFTETPGCFNLSAGEKLRFEWTSGEVMFMTYPFQQNWTNTSSRIFPGYSEANGTDLPGANSVLNSTSRYFEYVGPIDFWTWSKEQTAHTYLADKWNLYGVLPYGMPYLEFWADA